jgi:hypothetical protein
MRNIINHLDCSVILKQKNSRWYVDAILKNHFRNNGETLYMYILDNNLYDEAGISENELDLYDLELGLILFREYLSDEENERKDPKRKKMYDMFMNINMNGSLDRILNTIFAFADIKKEIPEEVIKKYLDRADDLDIRFLCSNIMIFMVPPVEFLKRLIKNTREYSLFVQTLHNNIGGNSNEQKTINTKITWKLVNDLVKNDFVKTESFKSFFYNILG